MLWHYRGGTGHDVGFICVWQLRFDDGVEAQLDGLYDRVTFIARYLRQTMDWAWALDEGEARRYERAANNWIKRENGESTVTPEPAAPNPFGFGDYEGGG